MLAAGEPAILPVRYSGCKGKCNIAFYFLTYEGGFFTNRVGEAQNMR